MNAFRHTMLCLLALLPLCFAACTPDSDSGMTGRAVGVAEEAPGDAADTDGLQGEARTRRVSALLGYEGEYEEWGVAERDRVLPAEDFYLLEVEGVVLVIESRREREEDRIVDEFLAAGIDGKGSDVPVYRFLGFASDGGLGTTRFELQGSADSVIAE